MRLLVVVLALGGLSGASGPESFQFWPGSGAERAPGFERMGGHPCGEVAHAKVSKLPTKKSGPLESEVVVELDHRGRVIRRWPMPVDFLPRALRREEMLFALGDHGFWVRPNGSFRKATTIPAPDDKPVECDLARVFGASEYARCSVFVDLETRKQRTLGYQAVCT